MPEAIGRGFPEVYIRPHPMRIPLTPLLLGALLAVSCEPSGSGEPEVELITDVVVSYVESTGTVHLAARIEPSVDGAELDTVVAFWFGSSGLYAVTADTLGLNDHGESGDILSDDRVYSVSVALSSLANAPTGGMSDWIYAAILASYDDGRSFSASDSTQLGNLRPVVVEVISPDTLLLPISGLALDTLRVTVSDANGLDDIAWVGYTSLKPDSSYANGGNPILLYDDGGSTIFYQSDLLTLTSGDALAGDGTYAYIVVMDPATPAGTYVWTFLCRDTGNLSSEPVVRAVVVQ